MKRFMDIVGPRMDFIADRLWLCILTAAVLILIACLLSGFGLIVIVGAGVMFALYVRWDLAREYTLNITNQEDESKWEDKSRRHA